MSKFKAQNKSKFHIPKQLVFRICAYFACLLQAGILCFCFCNFAFAQEGDLELTLDISSNALALPKAIKPDIDLSGRGFNRDASWPQTLAAKEALERWRKDIGFGGFYRLQYNLWEIHQLDKDKDLQNKLLANYEEIIKTISNSGGIVILDIFGMPVGWGNTLDKKSPPRDLRAFKALVKGVIRDLSCNKKYNIWYEVWNAPDLDDFFLGRKQDYLNLYRSVAESIKELEAETKINIPVGGPSTSWWFRAVDGNTILTPERSLIYELIKFCYGYRLPLDFISWHAYSTDPATEKENTIYNKTAPQLIREWLSYFKFDRNTPLIIDEWNYDRNANLLPERDGKSYISASYIPSRVKNMSETGIDYQLYFCLEDFENNKEGVVRNVGAFSFEAGSAEYKGEPKSVYNVFKMLANLGTDVLPVKLNDEFAGAIATETGDSLAILIYNYIDPEIATNYLSRNIATLDSAERKVLLDIIKSDRLEKILQRQIDTATIRTSSKVKALLSKAMELNEQAKKFSVSNRNIKLEIKNIKENYLYERYTVDASCGNACEFVPKEEKEIASSDNYQETIVLEPYSVKLIILKKKPKEEPIPVTAEVKPESPDTQKDSGAQPPPETKETPVPNSSTKQ